MILFDVRDLNRYETLFPAVACTMRYLETNGIPAPGKYALENGYFMIQEGETEKTEETALFEAHSAFIDVQIVLEGSEYISWTYLSGLEPVETEIKETLHYAGNGKQIRIDAGEGYVMYPQDGHKACLTNGEPTHYRKLVIKCPVER